MLSVSSILDTLSREESLEVKKIEKILKLTKKGDKSKLDIALKALTKIGIVELNSNGEFIKNNDQSLIEARLRCSSKGYCFAIRDDGQDDIYIRDQHLNHAWNGDRVLIKILREGVRRRSPEGSVQCILGRATSSVLSLIGPEEDSLEAIPLDDRILTTISLPDEDVKYIEDRESQNLVDVKIDRYPLAQFPAQGHVVRALPLDAGFDGDKDILLSKVNITKDSAEPRIALRTPLDKQRLDLTNQQSLLFKSWEGINAPALPAISIEPYKGGFKLWVHIPSVAERIKLGSVLDKWLREKGSAHCLGDEWIPLLTKQLIKASEFRLNETTEAISVQLEIDKDGVVEDWNFVLSYVKPVAQIGPAHLKAISTRKPRSRLIPTALKPVKEQLNQIQTAILCATQLHDHAKKEGLLELELPHPNISQLQDHLYQNPISQMDQWSLPLNLEDPQSILTPIVRTVNKAWCQQINSLGLPGIKVESEPIDINVLNDVAKSAICLDLELQLNENGFTSPLEMSEAFSKSPSKRLLDKLLRHAVPSSVFSICTTSKNILESEMIEDDVSNIHTNSEAPCCYPTYNYFDIINQHIQLLLLKEGKTRPNNRQKTQLELGKKGCSEELKWDLFSEPIQTKLREIVDTKLLNDVSSNYRKARALRNSFISMAQSRTAEPLVGQTMQAIISGVQSYGFFAEILPSMAEGLVHVSSLNDDWYEYRSRQNKLVGRKSKKAYQLGDKINVRITKVDILRNQIDLELCPSQEQGQLDPNTQTTNLEDISVENNPNIHSDE